MFEHFESYGSRVALVDGDTGDKLTFRELEAKVRCFAAGLQARGLRKGDVLALFAPNSPEWVIPFLGTILAGGVVTTIQAAGFPGEAPFLYSPTGIDRVLQQTGALFVVTVPKLLATAAACVAAAHCEVREILLIDGNGQSGDPHKPIQTQYGAEIPVTSFREVLRDAAVLKVQGVKANDVAVIAFSAGIGGLPKGALLTQRNLVASLTILEASGRLRLMPQDTFLGFLPFAHVRGMVMVLLNGIRHGAKVVTMSRMSKFQPERLLQTLIDEEVTISFCTPTCIGFYANHPIVDKFLPLKLRQLVVGGAPLEHELAQAAKKRLGLESIRQVFSMTEMCSATHLGDVTSSKHGSIGKLLPGLTCKIINPETGEVLAPGKSGELCVKGPNMMKGYCQNSLDHQEATDMIGRDGCLACPLMPCYCNGSLRQGIIDSDGYLHTGDVAYVDKDHDFFIVDRLKDLIKVQGNQVAPAEIEAVLLTCPGVADAGVIGVPAKRAGDGQVPKAFVVKTPDSSLTEEDIKVFVAARMVAYKCVFFVEFLEALPRNTMLSKISRKELRRMEGNTFA